MKRYQIGHRNRPESMAIGLAVVATPLSHSMEVNRTIEKPSFILHNIFTEYPAKRLQKAPKISVALKKKERRSRSREIDFRRISRSAEYGVEIDLPAVNWFDLQAVEPFRSHRPPETTVLRHAPTKLRRSS